MILFSFSFTYRSFKMNNNEERSLQEITSFHSSLTINIYLSLENYISTSAL